MNRGAIYAVTTPRWIEECVRSAETLKRHCPDLPITLFTDQRVQAPCFDQVALIEGIPEGIPAQRWHKNYGQKIFALSRSPYEQTLYLDSDTIVLGSLDAMFDWLDEADICLAHQPLDVQLLQSRKPEEKTWMLHNPRDCTALEYEPENYFNAGVMLLKKSERMNNLFALWWKRWQQVELGVVDQDVLNELLFEGAHEGFGLRFKAFSNKVYNVRPIMIRFMSEEEKRAVRILHCRSRGLIELVLAHHR